MITTPLLKNTEAKQRWSYIAFTVLCVALAMLCWTAIGGTKSFPVSEETRVGTGASSSSTGAAAAAADTGPTGPTGAGPKPVLTMKGIWIEKDPKTKEVKDCEYPSPVNHEMKPVKGYDPETFGGTVDIHAGTWATDGLTVYHGSSKVVEASKPHDDYKGIWMSPDFKCSLGGATSKVHEDASGIATVVEFMLKNDANCKPFLLLGIGAEHNAKILYANGFKQKGLKAAAEPYVTMGRPSKEIQEHLEEFCAKSPYCGWRSPFDQNEVFICNKCMPLCLTSTKRIYQWDGEAESNPMPQNMATQYWFPKTGMIRTLGQYEGEYSKGEGAPIEKAKKAQEKGETLAFYAEAGFRVKEIVGKAAEAIAMTELTCSKGLPAKEVADKEIDGTELDKCGCKKKGGFMAEIPIIEEENEDEEDEEDDKRSSSTK